MTIHVTLPPNLRADGALGRAAVGWRAHLAALGCALAAILLLFHRDASAMASLWWNSSTYGHCLFVLPIALWLIQQRRREVAQVIPRAWAPGLAAVALAAFIWLIGDAGGVALIRHAALVGMVQASVLAILGPAVVRALLFPLFYLVFLIPFGDVFVPPLQTVTARMAMGLLGLSGIPAHIDGVFITTPDGWFEVAEACSGVKFLVAMVAYGALAANVCFKSWPRRVAFMALCVIAPILANGVRAFATIYAAHLSSAKAASGFDHVVYGWFFFAFVMVLVMALSWKFFDRKLGEPWLKAIPQVIGKPRHPAAIAVAVIAIALLPMVWSATAGAAGRHNLPHAVSLPRIAGWTPVSNASGYSWTPRFDGADHRLYGRYRNAAGREVDLGVALYGWQGEGREIVAFGQGAIDPASKWAWTADVPSSGQGRTIRIVAPGRIERIARSWYFIDGRITSSASEVKLLTLRARLMARDQGAGSLIVSSLDPKALDQFISDRDASRIMTRLFVQAER